MAHLTKIILTFACILLLTSCLRTRKDIAYDRPGYGNQQPTAKKSQPYNPGGYNIPPSATTAPTYSVPTPAKQEIPVYKAPTPGTSSSQQMARMQITMQEINSQLRELSGRLEVVEKQVSQNNLNMNSINVDQKLKNYEIALANLEAKVNSGNSVNVQNSNIQTTNLNAFGRGESYFKQKDWQKAISEYQLYREQYPKGKDYSEATYKIGVCFQELNMKSEAKVFYQEAVSKYPRSKAAKKSKFRLKQL